jgi:hypothetical protein
MPRKNKFSASKDNGRTGGRFSCPFTCFVLFCSGIYREMLKVVRGDREKRPTVRLLFMLLCLS